MNQKKNISSLLISGLLLAACGDETKLSKFETPKVIKNEYTHPGTRITYRDDPYNPDNSGPDCLEVKTHQLPAAHVQMKANDDGFVFLTHTGDVGGYSYHEEMVTSFTRHGDKRFSYIIPKEEEHIRQTLSRAGRGFAMSYPFLFETQVVTFSDRQGTPQTTWDMNQGEIRDNVYATTNYYDMIKEPYTHSDLGYASMLYATSLGYQDDQLDLQDERFLWTWLSDESLLGVHLVNIIPSANGTNAYLVRKVDNSNYHTYAETFIIIEKDGYAYQTPFTVLHIDQQEYEGYLHYGDWVKSRIYKTLAIGDDQFLILFKNLGRNHLALVGPHNDSFSVLEVWRMPEGVLDMAYFRNELLLLAKTGNGAETGDLTLYQYDLFGNQISSNTIVSDICHWGQPPMIETSGNTVAIAWRQLSGLYFNEYTQQTHCRGPIQVNVAFAFCELLGFLKL